jgi:hypothetical protein
MKFTEKNKIGKGRPLGSKNVATQEIRENYSLFVSKNMGKIQKDFDSLEPMQRINTLISISKFVLPALQSIEIKDDSTSNLTPIFVEMITPEEVKIINDNLENYY